MRAVRIKVDIPRAIRPAQFDARLAQGWLRVGSLMIRTPALHIDDVLHEVVHVRVSLDAPVTRRSSRRTLRRNRTRFRCVVGPATVDDARCRLYELTRPRFIGPVVRDLRLLVKGELPDVFDTREVAVYDGEQLVAVSWFDVGADGLYSVMGLHDPAYRRHGLGRYTMLEEMAWGRQTGRRHYYPGYVAPGLDSFDYKLALGPTEWLDPNGRWRPVDGALDATPLMDRADRRVATLEAALAERGIDSIRRAYPLFWIGRLRQADHRLLSAQRHLRCASRLGGRWLLVAEHLADRDRFTVGWANTRDDVDAFDGFDRIETVVPHCETRMLRYVNPRWMTDSVDEAVAQVVHLLGG